MKMRAAVVVGLGLLFAVAACDTAKTDGDDAKKDDAEKKADKPAVTPTASTGPQPAVKTGTTGAVTPTTATPSTASTVATPGGNIGDLPPGTARPVTSPELQTYPDIANKISDGCTKAYAIAATAPSSVGDSYAWNWTRQAMLANQQFKVVGGEPTGLGEVAFELHLADDKWQRSWVLVARCNNGLSWRR
jgi:hypothetical protein